MHAGGIRRLAISVQCTTNGSCQFQQSYVMPTVTLLPRLEKQRGASPLELRADQRIVYSRPVSTVIEIAHFR